MSTSLSAADTRLPSWAGEIVPPVGCSLLLPVRITDVEMRVRRRPRRPRLLNRTPSAISLDGWSPISALVNSIASFESADSWPNGLKSALLHSCSTTLIGAFKPLSCRRRPLHRRHRRLLERVAEQAGVALHNSLVSRRLRRRSPMLTGLRIGDRSCLHLRRSCPGDRLVESGRADSALRYRRLQVVNDTGTTSGDRALCGVANAPQSVPGRMICARATATSSSSCSPQPHAQAAEAGRAAATSTGSSWIG